MTGTTSNRASEAPVAPDGWWIYRGTGEPHDGIDRLPAPPRWRTFDGRPLVQPDLGEDGALGRRLGELERARTYRANPDVLEMVNAAIHLRRPLLVTGKPGTGKSTLAYSIAYELKLGPVLVWPVTSRVTLNDGQYRYDAIGRLQEANLAQTAHQDASPATPDIGRYLRLGPLGTALLPQARPRVLLVDELDKSDIDLPNDLLHVFEEGQFEIPELARLPEEQSTVSVMITGSAERVTVERGLVRCRAFPIVVITSNGEREFPPAFLRRCLRLHIAPPDLDGLSQIVAAHLGSDTVTAALPIIERFLHRRENGDLATDQLLNAIYLATSGARPPEETRERMSDALLRPLDTAGPG